MQACNAEQKKLQKAITQAEANTDRNNIESATALAKLYEEYALKFKDDEATPDYLFKAAELYKNTGSYTKSIELYSKLIEQYPQHESSAVALYNTGAMYENMGDIQHAKKSYELLIKQYPEHKMAKVAQYNLPYIGTPVTKEIVSDTEKGTDIAN